MEQFQKYTNDFTLLVESGFIAASHADEDSASKLFKAAQLLKDSNTLPKLGFGYIHLMKLELPQAKKKFEEVLKLEPKNDVATALLGLSIALTIKDVDEGEKILQNVLKGTQDPTVKTMAETSLDFIERFIKKAPVPLQNKPKAKKKGKK